MWLTAWRLVHSPVSSVNLGDRALIAPVTEAGRLDVEGHGGVVVGVVIEHIGPHLCTLVVRPTLLWSR